MIKINLAKKPKKGGGFSLSIPSISLKTLTNLGRGGAEIGDLGAVLKRWVVPVIACAVILYAWIDYKDAEVRKEAARLVKIQDDIKTLDLQISKSAELEKIKKNLEGDEKTLRSKLAVIDTLLTERGGTYSTLKKISEFLPKEIWMKTLSVKNKDIQIAGSSLHFNFISDLMKTLNESGLFSTVETRSQRLEVAADGRTSVNFEMALVRK